MKFILLLLISFTCVAAFGECMCNNHAGYNFTTGTCYCNGTGWCGTTCQYNATGPNTDPNSGNWRLCSGNDAGISALLTTSPRGILNPATCECTCHHGWFGTNCNSQICPTGANGYYTTSGIWFGPVADSPWGIRLCNDHGEPGADCTNCVCDQGWTRDYCVSHCVNLWVDGNLCNLHGTPLNNSCTSCVCNSGWCGDKCQYQNGSRSLCSNHGTFSSATCGCVCDAHYIGSTCGTVDCYSAAPGESPCMSLGDLGYAVTCKWFMPCNATSSNYCFPAELWSYENDCTP